MIKHVVNPTITFQLQNGFYHLFLGKKRAWFTTLFDLLNPCFFWFTFIWTCLKMDTPRNSNSFIIIFPIQVTGSLWVSPISRQNNFSEQFPCLTPQKRCLSRCHDRGWSLRRCSNFGPICDPGFRQLTNQLVILGYNLWLEKPCCITLDVNLGSWAELNFPRSREISWQTPMLLTFKITTYHYLTIHYHHNHYLRIHYEPSQWTAHCFGSVCQKHPMFWLRPSTDVAGKIPFVGYPWYLYWWIFISCR